MDRAKITRTYSNNERPRESKGLSDLFDQVVSIPHHQHRHVDTPQKSAVKGGYRKREHAKTEKKQQKKTAVNKDAPWRSSGSSRECSPALFKDTFEIVPKKSKKNPVPAKSGKYMGKKSARRRISNARPAHLKDKESAADEQASVPHFTVDKVAAVENIAVDKDAVVENLAVDKEAAVENIAVDKKAAVENVAAGGSDEFEIETMRRRAVDAVGPVWTCQEPGEDRRPSLSLSPSMSDASGADLSSDTSNVELQPRTPAPGTKRSFVKIRTPAKAAGQMEEPWTLGDSFMTGKPGEGCESYSTVYTWTTAAGTDTNTATHTVVPKDCGAREKDAADAQRSPTLVLKSWEPEQLHSTAICPRQEHGHLSPTPMVSPIRQTSETVSGAAVHHTPAASTVKLSPRRPRKTHSSFSVPAGRAPPKCSTMLFTSFVADAGDAPLDISSIREDLPFAMDLNTSKRIKTDKGTGLDTAAVLTSTPQGRGYKKFSLNLSSLYGPIDEEDLQPLRCSVDVVNSQEIVATSLCDEFHDSVTVKPSQDEQEGNGMKVRSTARPHSHLAIGSPGKRSEPSENEKHQVDRLHNTAPVAEDSVTPCPISILGLSGRDKLPTCGKSSPADSGFLDMQDVPPDDITVLSRRAMQKIAN